MAHFYRREKIVIDFLKEIKLQRNLLFIDSDGTISMEKRSGYLDFLDYYMAVGILIASNRDKYLSAYQSDRETQQFIDRLNRNMKKIGNQFSADCLVTKILLINFGYNFIIKTLTEVGLEIPEQKIIVEQEEITVSSKFNLEICNVLLLTDYNLAKFHSQELSEKFPNHDTVKIINNLLFDKEEWEECKFSIALRIYQMRKKLIL